MSGWLYDEVKPVPEITDAQIAEMRHTEPLIKSGEGMYRRIKGSEVIDPRGVSFMWDAVPVGKEFRFHQLNEATIITQHTGYLFKPSLAEVYSWMRIQIPNWKAFSFFCLGSPERIGGSTTCFCKCLVMGGKKRVKGEEIVLPSGVSSYELQTVDW